MKRRKKEKESLEHWTDNQILTEQYDIHNFVSHDNSPNIRKRVKNDDVIVSTATADAIVKSYLKQIGSTIPDEKINSSFCHGFYIAEKFYFEALFDLVEEAGLEEDQVDIIVSVKNGRAHLDIEIEEGDDRDPDPDPEPKPDPNSPLKRIKKDLKKYLDIRAKKKVNHVE